ncbi:MAG: response regulator [Lentilitoribacter sp.]
MQKRNSSNRVIVIDDDVTDVSFLERAVRKFDKNIDLVHICETEGIEEKLEQESVSCILLDLKMPKEDGFSVLKRIRKNALLKLCPVVIFSSSLNPSDIRSCYESGANAYTVKPSSIAEYENFAQNFLCFWLKEVRLPS